MIEGYSPSPDDIEYQNGPDEGRVKSKHLAEIGARAEEQERNKITKHKFKSFVTGENFSDVQAEAGNKAGEEAMANAVEERESQLKRQQGVKSKADLEFYGKIEAAKFLLDHERLSERAKKEREER